MVNILGVFSKDNNKFPEVDSAILTVLGARFVISERTPKPLRDRYDEILKHRLGDDVEVTAKNREALTKKFQQELGLKKPDGKPGPITVYAAELAEKLGGITPEVKAAVGKYEHYLKYGEVKRADKIGGLFDSKLKKNDVGEVEIELKNTDGFYAVNGEATKIKMGRPGAETKMENIIAATEKNEGGKGIQYSDGYPTLDGGITCLRLPVGDKGKMVEYNVKDIIKAGVILKVGNEEQGYTSIDFAKLRSKDADLSAKEKYALLQCKVQQKLEDVHGKYGHDKVAGLGKNFQESLLSFHYNLDVGNAKGGIINAVKNEDAKALAAALPAYNKCRGEVLPDLVLRRKLDGALLKEDDKTVNKVMEEKKIFTEWVNKERKSDPEYVKAVERTRELVETKTAENPASQKDAASAPAKPAQPIVEAKPPAKEAPKVTKSAEISAHATPIVAAKTVENNAHKEPTKADAAQAVPITPRTAEKPKPEVQKASERKPSQDENLILRPGLEANTETHERVREAASKIVNSGTKLENSSHRPVDVSFNKSNVPQVSTAQPKSIV